MFLAAEIQIVPEGRRGEAPPEDLLGPECRKGELDCRRRQGVPDVGTFRFVEIGREGVKHSGQDRLEGLFGQVVWQGNHQPITTLPDRVAVSSRTLRSSQVK